jgi:hypothetical protein
MSNIFNAVLCITVSIASMLALLEWGRWLGRRLQVKEDERARAGLGAVEGAVFALLGLLIAFTFSGAAARFEQRQQMIVDEANAIGTAWLRLDLLPDPAKAELRGLFRRYLDARLAAFEKVPDMDAVEVEVKKANALQGNIWTRAVAACQQASLPPTVGTQVLPALNEMFDIATSRTIAAQRHPPLIIFVMLGVLALMSSFLAGYAMAGGRGHNWVHSLGFALIVACTVYVILELEFPRIGLIRIDTADHVLIELRQSMD